MTENQAQKIKELMEKYNDILLVSMRLAITEDFTNLVILNKDDSDFELSELLHDKDEFSNYITREFLKQNSSSVIKDLRSMDEVTDELREKFGKAQKKLKFK